VVCLSGILVLAGAPALGGTIGLTWDPVPGATGYRAYYGTSSGQYSHSVNLGNVTSAILQGLQDCTNYFVALKAIGNNAESVTYSDEVSGWARPRIDSLSPVFAIQGTQVGLSINGANFESGASLIIDSEQIPTDIEGNPLIRVDSISIVSCTEIQALLTVEPLARGFRAAEVGDLALDLEVLNPDDVFGFSSSLLDIRFNEARVDINRSNSITEDRVDGSDLAWLAYASPSLEGEPRFNPDADLNGDGLVDGEDLALLAPRFGLCWSGSGWSESACD